jgi:hypothetical protein
VHDARGASMLSTLDLQHTLRVRLNLYCQHDKNNIEYKKWILVLYLCQYLEIYWTAH